MWKKVIIGVLLLAGGWWLVRYLMTPAPGTQVPDMGRAHVTEAQVSQTEYNSNPPTSGPHLERWVKPGIYTTPQSEGELIHSLEHGYIIISYNCEEDACKTLIQQLEQLAKKKKLFKLILVPRPELDTTIALTAWGYLDKFDEFDRKRIERFIDYHRDHGPEKTME